MANGKSCQGAETGGTRTLSADWTLIVDAIQNGPMPYLSPWASSQAVSGTTVGFSGGGTAARLSGRTAASTAALARIQARADMAILAGTQARAASTAPHGSTGRSSRWTV